MAIPKTVQGILDAIETELKPTLRNTDQHKGFCLALAEASIRLGGDKVLFDPAEPGSVEVLPGPDMNDLMLVGVRAFLGEDSAADYTLPPTARVGWTTEAIMRDEHPETARVVDAVLAFLGLPQPAPATGPSEEPEEDL